VPRAPAASEREKRKKVFNFFLFFPSVSQAGKGLLKVNGRPVSTIQPEVMRAKIEEPIMLLGKQRFAEVDIRVRVRGGGQIAQIYAIRQAIAKGMVAYYQKCKAFLCSLFFFVSARFVLSFAVGGGDYEHYKFEIKRRPVLETLVMNSQ